ncbi:MAG: hypothetical protein U1G07_03810 [Verrucomicrobiota bacterium]
MRNGNLRALILNQPMVMHILSEDIYLGRLHFLGQCTKLEDLPIPAPFPAAAVPPTVQLTVPRLPVPALPPWPYST